MIPPFSPAADAHDADLIVVGARGRGSMERLLLAGPNVRIPGVPNGPLAGVTCAATLWVGGKPLVAMSGGRFE